MLAFTVVQLSKATNTWQKRCRTLDLANSSALHMIGGDVNYDSRMQRPPWISQGQMITQLPDVQLFWLDLAQTEQSVKAALDQLPPMEVSQINQLLRPISRRNRALCQSTLRWLLAQRLDVQPQSLQFQKTPQGKPQLMPATKLRFSLSHSRDFAVIAIAENAEIGVDLEFVNLARNIDGLAKYALTEMEQKQLQAIHPSDRSEQFYRLWTCKEAAIKAQSGDISSGLLDWRVQEKSDGTVQLQAARMNNLTQLPLLIELYAPTGYRAALALQPDFVS